MASRKPRLLIAGGGYADIPMIQAGRALGYHVITSGNRAEDLGHRHSDQVVLADFSDHTAMLRVAEDNGIDAICPACNDFSALTSAYVAGQLGLPGHDPLETAEVIHHKDRYRAFAQEHGIPCPKAGSFRSVDAALDGIGQFDFPVIVKPVDLTGGKGISRVERAADAASAITRAFEMSRAKRVVVEEFVEGTRHGITTLLDDGRIVFSAHDDEYYYKNPYLVSGASSPGTVSESAVLEIVRVLERMAAILSLRPGILHVQFIVSRHGRPIIIEICRRPPGDLYVNLVRHATGVDYASCIVRAACGLDFRACARSIAEQRFITRHCIMTSHNGVVQDVVVAPELRKRVVDELVWWQPGDVVEDYLVQKLGIVFVEFDSAIQMREQSPGLQETMKAVMCV